MESEEVSCKDFGREFQALAIAEEGERSQYLRFFFWNMKEFFGRRAQCARRVIFGQRVRNVLGKRVFKMTICEKS